ncbi:MAG: GspE/PulE family protein [Candidatus Cloacimonetes bacterium]|nr:GspE/PulE family protein [Candidatus Cloacimonadota bacterium]
MNEMNDNQLVAKLLKLKNIISEDIYNAVITKTNTLGNKSKVEEILIDEYHIDRDAVYTEIAKIYAIPKTTVNIENMTAGDIEEARELIFSLPKDIKEEVFQKRIIPYKIQKKKNESLIILSSIPTDNFTRTLANALKIKRFDVYYCPWDKIDKLISHISSKEEEKYLEDMLDKSESELEIPDQTLEDESEDLIEQEINKGALVYLFEAALIDGVKSQVSDVHVIPFNHTSVDIRFRQDGRLRLWKRKEGINPQSFLSVVKDRSSNVDRFKVDEAQDGFIQREIEGHTIRFRVSILPIVSREHSRHYESIVIRILDDRNVIDNIDKLGFLPRARQDFEEAVTKPQGLVIVTGPTGSGKSTTLLAALYHVITPEKNILTVEDPVEYVIKGARQIKISPKLDFNWAIRSILRHDPDIVMVGEMRDKETAEVAIKLANTGHLTFSTLHTNDAPSAISRLYKMEIETFLLAYAINIIVAQRLVRKLCKHCKRVVGADKHQYLMRNGITEEELQAGKVFEVVGCEKCRTTGYSGRVAIHEVILFTKEIRQAIVSAKTDINEDLIREIAKGQGMLSLREAGIELVRQGMTTIEEVIYTTTIA